MTLKNNTTYKPLPEHVKHRFQIIYAQATAAEGIYIFKNKKEKWGVLAERKRFTFLGTHKVLLSAKYESTHYDENLDMLVATTYPNGSFSKGAFFHFFDLEGKKRSKQKEYSYIKSDSFGNIMAEKKGEKWHDRRVAILNRDFKEIIPLEYKQIFALKPSLFKAQLPDERYGIIDSDNMVVLDFVYLNIFNSVANNKVILQADKQHYEIFDLKKRTTEALAFSKILRATSNTYGAPNKSSLCLFKSIIDCVEDQDGYFLHDEMDQYHGKWGIVAADAQVLIPNDYDYIDFLRNPNFYKVAKGHFEFDYGTLIRGEERNTLKNVKWGVIDAQNNIIVPIEYDWVEEVHDSIWLVNKGGTVYYNDDYQEDYWAVDGGKTGAFNMRQLIVPIAYDHVMVNWHRVYNYLFVKNGNDNFYEDGSYDVFDFNGRQLTENKPLARNHIS